MTTLVLVIGVSLGISFLCSILEAVLLSISHSYVAILEEKGHSAGPLLAGMRRNIDEPIAAILTLNTISHTVGAAVAGAIALEVFGDRWLALFSAVLTLLILVFSEIIPKTLGATWWQELAPMTARVLRWMILLMKPILIPLAWFNRLITPRDKERSKVSRAELEVLAEIGRREGAIDHAEWRIMTNVMTLDEVLVGHVMTPRTRITAVPSTATLEEAQRVMLHTGRLRLPVYDGTIDEIIGVLLARDLWKVQLEGGATLLDVIREPTFVPASTPVEEQIQDMRQRRIKMAIVLDEYGGTAGIVTLEDLIEEIVGEIQDEHEVEPRPFEETPEGETRFDGAVPVADVNERFDLSLPEEDYDTAGGFVFGTLGRVPDVGDEVAVPEGALRVVAMDGRRVARLAYVPDPARRAGRHGHTVPQPGD
ncbi:MAG TPA: hemolysin family protein [Longimicrobiales bacterium]|nr:hemolysin family protein [Longimicrobiales bacterium]